MPFSPTVCLVNPPYVSGECYYLAPPLGLLCVAAQIELALGVSPIIVDLALEVQEGNLGSAERIIDNAVERLTSIPCDEYGFSVQCFNLPIAVVIARRLSTLCKDRKIYFGGHGPALIELHKRPEFDFIQKYRPTWLPLQAELKWDRLRYTLVPCLKRYAAVSKQPTGIIEIARGCPFSCSFCSIPLVFGRKRSYKPLDLVLEEIENYAASGITNLHFVDDVLTVNNVQLTSLLEMLGSLPFPISWSGMTRVDLVDQEVLRKMAHTGCYSLLYGVESALHDRRTSISKGGRPYPNLVEFLDWHLQVGIRPALYFLVNLPNETDEELFTTFTEAARLSILDPGCCKFQPPRVSPNTQMYDEVSRYLAPDFKTKYAATLIKTFPVGQQEIFDEIVRYPDIYATYYTSKAPYNSGLWRMVADYGSELLEKFPNTILHMAEFGILKDFFSFARSQKHTVTTDDIMCEFMRSMPFSVREALSLENWLNNTKGPETYISTFNLQKAKQLIRDGKMITSCEGGPSIIYRRSNI